MNKGEITTLIDNWVEIYGGLDGRSSAGRNAKYQIKKLYRLLVRF